MCIRDRPPTQRPQPGGGRRGLRPLTGMSTLDLAFVLWVVELGGLGVVGLGLGVGVAWLLGAKGSR
eukprot:3421946-Alexandrium_andersonii.AAC.1